MSTNDVPGANPANKDLLCAGGWAEHADGSLIFVKGNEGGTVVYEIYDLMHTPVTFYTDMMREEAFKKQFSWPPVGSSAEKWTWHDKTPFPWDRVKSSMGPPMPQHLAQDTISAAAKVAQSLNLRATELTESEVSTRAGRILAAGKTILSELAAAFTENK